MDTPTNWYQLNGVEVIKQLNTEPTQGLSTTEAQRRLEQYGLNELVEKGGRTRWQILAEQFTNILTVILIVAAETPAVTNSAMRIVVTFIWAS